MTQFVGRVEIAEVMGRNPNGAFTFGEQHVLEFQGDDPSTWEKLAHIIRSNVDSYDVRGTGQATFHTGIQKVRGTFSDEGVSLTPKDAKEFLTFAQEVYLLPKFNVSLGEFSTGVEDMADSMEVLATDLVEVLDSTLDMDSTTPSVEFDEVLLETAEGSLIGGGVIKKLKSGLRIGEQVIVDQIEAMWNVANLVSEGDALLDNLEVVAVLENGSTITMQAEGNIASAKLIDMMTYQKNFEVRLKSSIDTLVDNLYGSSLRIINNAGGVLVESGMIKATKSDQSEGDDFTTTFVIRNNKVRRYDRANARKAKVTDIGLFDLIGALRELKTEGYVMTIEQTEQSMFEVGYAAIALRTDEGTQYISNLGSFVGYVKKQVTQSVENDMGAELDALKAAAISIQESIARLHEQFDKVTGYVETTFSDIPSFEEVEESVG